MKFTTHEAGRASVRKQQERIRFYESRVKETEASRKRKSGTEKIRK